MTGPRYVIDYTNWRGERGRREIEPIGLEWGSNKWHPEPQMLLVALDCAKGDERTFAVGGIHAMEPTPRPARRDWSTLQRQFWNGSEHRLGHPGPRGSV